MDKYNKEKLKKAGMDIDEYCKRCKEDTVLIETFLKKLIDNNKSFIQLFENLKEEVSKNNITSAFNTAKNLKGLCSEFYIMGLGKVLTDLSVFLSSGDIKPAAEMMPEVVHQYEVITEALKAALY